MSGALVEMCPETVDVSRFGVQAIGIVGTRDPAVHQIRLAKLAAITLSDLGYVVRTGAALGIDKVAMDNVDPSKVLEVFLPWAAYNRDIIPAHAIRHVYDPWVHTDWADSVSKYHPALDKLSQAAFKLHARNYGIVRDDAIVCAFPKVTAYGDGGTGQAMRIARALGIPLLVVDQFSDVENAEYLDRIAQALLKAGRKT